VSTLERSELLTQVKGVDAALDACKPKPREGEIGGVRSIALGEEGEKWGTRRRGRDAWRRGGPGGW
jgi:hypothetical protein